MDTIESSRHWIVCQVRSLISNLQKKIINVYGPTPSLLKRQVWLELDGILNRLSSDFWILGGDFNVLLRDFDKKGGSGKALQSQKDFQNFVDRNYLIELHTSNGCFTWTNRRKDFCSIAEKLDRFFFKGNLGAFPFTLGCKINFGAGSDHFPIQLDIEGERANLVSF